MWCVTKLRSRDASGRLMTLGYSWSWWGWRNQQEQNRFWKYPTKKEKKKRNPTSSPQACFSCCSNTRSFGSELFEHRDEVSFRLVIGEWLLNLKMTSPQLWKHSALLSSLTNYLLRLHLIYIEENTCNKQRTWLLSVLIVSMLVSGYFGCTFSAIFLQLAL